MNLSFNSQFQVNIGSGGQRPIGSNGGLGGEGGGGMGGGGGMFGGGAGGGGMTSIMRGGRSSNVTA